MFEEALGEDCVDAGLWKVIFVSGCILFNHHDSPIFNIFIGEIFKYCACASCTIQYTIGEELTQNPQNPPIKVKMKIGDIEFEIEAQPDQIQTAVDQILTTVTEHLKKHQPHPNRRTPSPPPKSRNLQRRNPKTLGRKLVQRTPRLRRRPHRTRTQRLPLRPNRRSPRTS